MQRRTLLQALAGLATATGTPAFARPARATASEKRMRRAMSAPRWQRVSMRSRAMAEKVRVLERSTDMVLAAHRTPR